MKRNDWHDPDTGFYATGGGHSGSADASVAIFWCMVIAAALVWFFDIRLPPRDALPTTVSEAPKPEGE